ncbi:FAD-dependent oxidoreductase [Wenzhouxiangella sp. XN79A]|uniref:FAD-dependent oxidoreductase n=1 Tax=Wenzhouxiangella sp. XN79A TaxID=2724193 RepID=UPI00144AAE49|nr:FAD-dependent oxidoreductase [Wenzhouxiangella sp. XN79A]NKI33968.1 FAD-dependent oxidoreductase [Wenzhouxiangella sp. XN79A]
MKIVIIGAGIVGSTTALVLTERGIEVTLIDAEPEPGRGTSHANGSSLTPAHAEPWNPPGAGRKLLGALLRRRQAYRVYPQALPGLVRWGTAFLRESTPARYYPNARHCIRLAFHATRCLAELRERHALQYDQRLGGSLELYRTARGLAAAIELRRRIGDPDIEYEQLDPTELVGAEPALAPVADQFVAALRFPAHESGDARLFSLAAAARAQALGATLQFATRVRTIEPAGNGKIRISATIDEERHMYEADRVILCTGADTRRLLEPLGLRVPIYPVQGYSLTLPVGPEMPAPAWPLLDFERRFVTARLGPNRLRIAGLADFTGGNRSLRPERLDFLRDNAAALLPELAELIRTHPGEAWTGLRPMTPDGPPLIGPTPVDGLWLNTGHGAMGWTMAAGSADLLADRLLGEAPKIAPEGLDAERAFR